MDVSSARCICLTGPTACGKSDLALEIARELPAEIISVDSAMVYRGMDIGTAKPGPAARAAVPHHLVDILDPAEPYSAGRFLDDAEEAIAAVASRGALPLLVGGTLLYLRALRHGLARLPKADAALRLELDREAAELGWPALHRRLAAVDPRAAGRIAAADRQRIQRALEVYMLTGRPLSALQQEKPAEPRAKTAREKMVVLALEPADRAGLGERIRLRFDSMVESGFVGEVETLRARRDLHPGMPSMRAVGYRQVWGYLAERYDWQVAREKAIVATRQLAKRQLTWLRSETDTEKLEAFSPGLAEKLLERIGSEFARWT